MPPIERPPARGRNGHSASAEPEESLQDLVKRQRERADRLLALPLEERERFVGLSRRGNGNGGNGQDDTCSG
jgi:hypothetical protein